MDVYKILGQVWWEGSSEMVAYTVPVPEAESVGTVDLAPRAVFQVPQTLVTSIVVCNQDSSSHEFTIRLKESSGVADDEQEILFFESSLSAKSTKILSLGLMLSSGNQIKVKASSVAKVSFNLFGVETT